LDFEEQTDYAKNYGVYVYNNDFYNELIKGLRVSSDKNRLSFFHLFGLHPPYYGITDFELVDKAKEEEICFTVIFEYINQLKNMGLYDNSFIMITADHGLHGNVCQSDPVMLIKRCSYTGNEVLYNSAPGVVRYDLLPTLLDEVNGKDVLIKNGISLFKLNEDEIRERLVRNPNYDVKYKDVPKCNGVGVSSINVYNEYIFYGRVSDIDLKDNLSKTESIFDFWY